MNRAVLSSGIVASRRISSRALLSTAAPTLPPPPALTSSTAVMTSERQFPTWSLLPKEETQALGFIKKHPEYDGRGIRLAVLDTGVDPAAAGLSNIVDLIDATGTGDVPLKKIEPIASSSASSGSVSLLSPSGRTLKLSSKWKNPTGSWKVGIKLAYELWPDDLVARRKKERKRDWDNAHQELVAAAQRDLATFKASKPAKEDAKKTSEAARDAKTSTPSTATTPSTADSPTPSPEKSKRDDEETDARRLKRKDLDDRLDVLKQLTEAYDDVGPVLECVVWHDGSDWRAVIGGGEDDAIGIPVDEKTTVDLSDTEPLTDFRKERVYKVFGKQDLLSFSVNILNDGELLSIVTVSGAHGTHVAGICAASHPDAPDLNGIAPGCEIISIKIGDRRVKGMETSQALLRAAKAILDTKSDIVNMSFGEDGAWGLEDRGAFITALRDEVVRRRDVIFVTSAGNAGPALTTIGSPANCSSLISVGAYVTKAMQAAEYALLESVPNGPTTWSSRGPTYDGDKGMVCWAPGAAITCVPRYVLRHSQLMNGTSMASPSACGGIALVLSALRAEKVGWTPASVRKAVQDSSKDVSDPQNIGLLQVERLYDQLIANQDKPDRDVEWIVQVTPSGRGEPMRGVYLRSFEETSKVQQLAVNVAPKFKVEDTDQTADFDMDLVLTATQTWIRTPEYLAVNGAGRLFNIRVDASQLDTGYHTGEIQAHDHGRLVFTIPITVAKPEAVKTPKVTYTQSTSPGALQRHYIAVPQGATWADLEVRSSKNATPLQYWIHGVQLLPQRRLSKTESSFVFALVDGEAQKKQIKVTGGVTLELVCTQGWSSVGTGEVEVSLDFHGLELVGQADRVYLDGAEGYSQFACSSSVRPEPFAPSVAFEWRRTVIGPKEATIRTLGERDRLANGRNLFEIVLTYGFKQSKKATTKFTSGVQGNLYDNAFAVLGNIQDSRSRLYHFSDVYEKEVELEKGEYTYRLQIVHDSLAVLEKCKNLPIRCDVKLDGAAKGVKLVLARDHVAVFQQDKEPKNEGVKVQVGERRAFIIDGRLQGDLKALYEDAKAGDHLLGKLKLTKDADKAAYPVSYLLPPAPAKDDKPDEPKPEPKKLIDHQVELAKKLDDDKERVAYLSDLAKQNGDHLPTLVAHLEALRPKDRTKPPNDVEALTKAADAILNRVDEQALASFYGFKRPAETTEAKRTETARDAERDALVAALTAKAELLLPKPAAKEEDSASTTSEGSSSTFEKVSASTGMSGVPREEFDAIYDRLARWTEAPPHKDIALLHARRELLHDRPGTALVTTLKLLSELGAASTDAKWAEAQELKRELMKELGWSIWSGYEAKRKLVYSPPMGPAVF